MSAARISTTILASMRACTRTSASLKTVSVVIRVCVPWYYSKTYHILVLEYVPMLARMLGTYTYHGTMVWYVYVYSTYVRTHVPWHQWPTVHVYAIPWYTCTTYVVLVFQVVFEIMLYFVHVYLVRTRIRIRLLRM